MKLPQFFIFHISLFVSCAALAGRAPGFSMSAFNAAVPASNADAVFSPLAFELDCVVVSEAFDSIGRANFAERLGAFVGYDSVYAPIRAGYALAATNGFRCVSARAFLSPRLELVTARFRVFCQSEYRVQTCPLRPSPDGALAYLRAAMDGEMEDFRLPGEVVVSPEVSFCDLVSIRLSPSEPFPTNNTRRVAFAAADGRSREVEMMSDVRTADLWKARRFAMLRLGLSGGFQLYAALPDAGETLDSIRGAFAADRLEEPLAVFRTVGDPNVCRCGVDIAIPKISIDSSVDLKPAFGSAKLPLGGFEEIKMGPDTPLACVWQRMRFTLDEGGADAAAPAGDGEPRPVSAAKSFVCNRPFLFFVYHEPTRTIPVAGVYAGVAK